MTDDIEGSELDAGTEAGTDTVSAGDDERAIAALLAHAGPRAESRDPGADESLRLAGAVMRAELARRRGRALSVRSVVAAAAVLLTVAVGWLLLPPADLGVATVLARIEFVGGDVRIEGREGEALAAAGAALSTSEHLITGADGAARLSYRGAQLRIGEDTRLLIHDTELVLAAGTVYVDTGALTASGALPVAVRTPAGTVSHRGTQFLVTVAGSDVRVAVREGVILVARETGVVQARATDGHAEALTFAASGAVERSAVAAFGPEWDTFLAAARPLVIDRRTAYLVLVEASRELGLELEWASGDVRRQARGITLFAPQPAQARRALALVAATTTLQIDDSLPGRLRIDG